MVQLVGEARVDTHPSDYRTDLADSLPDHSRQLWFRIRPGHQEEITVAGRFSFRNQSGGEPDLHADTVWDAKLAAGLN